MFFKLLQRHKRLKHVVAIGGVLFIAWNLFFVISLYHRQFQVEIIGRTSRQLSHINGSVAQLYQIANSSASLDPVARKAMWFTYFPDWRRAMGSISPQYQDVEFLHHIRRIRDLVNDASILNSEIAESTLDHTSIKYFTDSLTTILSFNLASAMNEGLRAADYMDANAQSASEALASSWKIFPVIIIIWFSLVVVLIILASRYQNSILKRIKAENDLRTSNVHLETILNNSAQVFILLDNNHDVVASNKRAEAFIRTLSNAQLTIEQLFSEFMQVESSGTHNIHLFKRTFDVAKGGQRIATEISIQEHNGIGRSYEILFNPVYDVYGVLSGTCITAIDITERKKSAALLIESEERFRLLVRHSSDIITITDGDGRITYSSSSLKDILGYEPEELIGQSVFTLLHEDDRAYARERLTAIVGGAPPMSSEVRFRKKNGKFAYLEAIANNMLGVPSIHGIVINSRDITQRKIVEQQLISAKESAEHAKDSAEKMSRLKSAFLANMSHEIRTPITAILGFADVLADQVHDEEQREYAQTISRSGKRLLETLNSILDLAKIESGHFELNVQPINLSAEVERVFNLLQPMALRKGLRCTFEDSVEPLIVAADIIRLGQIVTNLLGNAIKFTDKGAISVSLSYLTDVDTSYAIIAVKDTGVGISREFLPHIFDEFKQESEGWARVYEGTGLGLAISKKLAEHMGGTLHVVSRRGEGSTFWVRLPLAQVDYPLTFSRHNPT